MKQLQSELKNAGYFSKNFKPTNYYGAQTKSAVEKYLADNMTLDQLIAATKYGQTNYKVYRLQLELAKLGLMPKKWKTTFFYGSTVKAAVAKYRAQ